MLFTILSESSVGPSGCKHPHRTSLKATTFPKSVLQTRNILTENCGPVRNGRRRIRDDSMPLTWVYDMRKILQTTTNVQYPCRSKRIKHDARKASNLFCCMGLCEVVGQIPITRIARVLTSDMHIRMEEHRQIWLHSSHQAAMHGEVLVSPVQIVHDRMRRTPPRR